MFSKLLRQAGRLALDNRAAASIEYVLITVLISVGTMAALTALAGGIIGIWSGVEGQIVESISGSDEEETVAAGLNLGNLGRTTKNQGSGKKKRKRRKPQG